MLSQVHYRPPGNLFRHLDGQYFLCFGDVMPRVAHKIIYRAERVLDLVDPTFVHRAKHQFFPQRRGDFARAHGFKRFFVRAVLLRKFLKVLGSSTRRSRFARSAIFALVRAAFSDGIVGGGGGIFFRGFFFVFFGFGFVIVRFFVRVGGVIFTGVRVFYHADKPAGHEVVERIGGEFFHLARFGFFDKPERGGARFYRFYRAAERSVASDFQHRGGLFVLFRPGVFCLVLAGDRAGVNR